MSSELTEGDAEASNRKSTINPAPESSYSYNTMSVKLIRMQNETLTVNIRNYAIILQDCFLMDPSERLSCAQLIEHVYFEQSRLLENYEQLLEEHSRRMRAEKHKMNRQKNQRARASKVCNF